MYLISTSRSVQPRLNVISQVLLPLGSPHDTTLVAWPRDWIPLSLPPPFPSLPPSWPFIKSQNHFLSNLRNSSTRELWMVGKEGIKNTLYFLLNSQNCSKKNSIDLKKKKKRLFTLSISSSTPSPPPGWCQPLSGGPDHAVCYDREPSGTNWNLSLLCLKPRHGSPVPWR